MSKGKVLMAMSGGIDSTISSLLLHEQGYEVIGITMKTWDYETSGGSKKETGCCSLDSINDARQLAVDCGFPHTILDIREEFGDFIIDNFVDILPKRASKGNAILYLCHKWGLQLNKVYACGDSGNDIDMFRDPINGIVVGNRSEELSHLKSVSISYMHCQKNPKELYSH